MSEMSLGSYEELETRIKALEERVERLENSLNSITEEVRSVLIDVRSTLSELDNPLNYIRELGIGDLIESTIEDKLKEIIEAKLKDLRRELRGKLTKETSAKGEAEKSEKTEKKRKIQEQPRELESEKSKIESGSATQKIPLEASFREIVEQKFRVNTYNEILNLIACAGCLTYIFGKKGVEKVLDEYSRRGWISHDVKLSLLHVASMLNLNDIPDEKEIGIEDHLIAMYLLDKLCRRAPVTEFIIILLLLSKYAGFPFIMRIVSQSQKTALR